MSNPVALLCSPRPGGVSDAVAHLVAAGVAEAGAELQLVPLRDYTFDGCIDCGGCTAPPHHCTLAGKNCDGRLDRAEEIFTLIESAPLLFISAPIYFYALPAHFKALIDRTQRFWAAQNHTPSGRSSMPRPPVKPALVSLVAGRPRGKQLFTGSLLTLRYFLSPLNATISETRLLRGLEKGKDLEERPAVRAALHAWGHDWGCRLMAGKVPGYVPDSHPGKGCGTDRPSSVT